MSNASRRKGVTGETEAAPSTITEAVEYVNATVAMLPDLERCVFPPWRWPRWWRLYRAITRRNDVIRAYRDAHGV